jgi:hypothetical protein
MCTGQRKEGNNEGTVPGTSQAPAIALPKGSGTIRGIEEKFAVNLVTGSLTISVATGPGGTHEEGAGETAFMANTGARQAQRRGPPWDSLHR